MSWPLWRDWVVTEKWPQRVLPGRQSARCSSFLPVSSRKGEVGLSSSTAKAPCGFASCQCAQAWRPGWVTLSCAFLPPANQPGVVSADREAMVGLTLHTSYLRRLILTTNKLLG
ncbi:unnamed protein product [Rangifer tarandus platyrhynchus]|uniref:Uncharacterized protein n=1 Tax=Rangifer tarandus platyrhynchus TaxID=3082113 RepID=A0AC60A298_RANTA